MLLRRTLFFRNALFIIFSLLALRLVMRPGAGFDLKPIYEAAKLSAMGHGSCIYAVGTASENQIPGLRSYVGPPFVQHPLWAFAFSPICSTVSFFCFYTFFMGVTLVSFCLFINTIARSWAPQAVQPMQMTLILFVTLVSEPFRYSILLGQTHILIMIASVLALFEEQRSRHLLAAALIAFAITVKVTPVILVMYWIVRRRWKVTLFSVALLAVLQLLTGFVMGWKVLLKYLVVVHSVTSGVLYAFNNQSFAAWWLGRHATVQEIFTWNTHPLPTSMKVLCSVLALITLLLGAFLDRNVINEDTPLYGGLCTLIGATVFTPLAWSHYAIILVVPSILLLAFIMKSHGTLRNVMAIFLILVCALNVYPFTTRSSPMHPFLFRGHTLWMLHSQFYAMLLSMIALGIMSIVTSKVASDRRGAARDFIAKPL